MIDIPPMQIMAAMRNASAEGYTHPNFCYSFQHEAGNMQPYRRSVHHTAWPAPFYHNDNHF